MTLGTVGHSLVWVWLFYWHYLTHSTGKHVLQANFLKVKSLQHELLTLEVWTGPKAFATAVESCNSVAHTALLYILGWLSASLVEGTKKQKLVAECC